MAFLCWCAISLIHSLLINTAHFFCEKDSLSAQRSASDHQRLLDISQSLGLICLSDNEMIALPCGHLSEDVQDGRLYVHVLDSGLAFDIGFSLSS